MFQKVTTAPQVKTNVFLFETHNLLTESTGTFIPYQEYLLLWIMLFSIIQDFFLLTLFWEFQISQEGLISQYSRDKRAGLNELQNTNFLSLHHAFCNLFNCTHQHAHIYYILYLYLYYIILYYIILYYIILYYIILYYIILYICTHILYV